MDVFGTAKQSHHVLPSFSQLFSTTVYNRSVAVALMFTTSVWGLVLKGLFQQIPAFLSFYLQMM